MADITINPLLLATVYTVLFALGGWVVSALGRRRQRVELHTQLDKVRLEGEIAEARRAETRRVEAEQLRLETAKAQRIIAETLQRTTEAQRVALDDQNKTLQRIAQVTDKTHEITNSAKTAMERVEQDLRNQLRASETALATARLAAAAALQASQDLAARDLMAARERIATLTQQLAQHAPVPPVVPPQQTDPSPRQP